LLFPFTFLPFRVIHICGNVFGIALFYGHAKFRKRALSNLSLAIDLHLSNTEIYSIAKKSFQNLVINLLEYPRLAYKKDLSKDLVCLNPEEAQKLHDQKQSIIFFCGHQANWETLFLEGTYRMKGAAIGRPINNPYLYDWILSIREKNHGKMIKPKNALKESLKELKKGSFLGILGDQANLESSYSYPFLGRKAYFSNAPALLSYRTNTPIIVATLHREKGKYLIHYSDPIWPNLNESSEKETVRLMDASLHLFEESIKKNPHEWLWIHNCYKQKTPYEVFRRFRMDSVAIFLPDNIEKAKELMPTVHKLKNLYIDNFCYLFAPVSLNPDLLPSFEETFFFKNYSECLRNDYRFKLIFDFTDHLPLQKHYKKFSALKILDLKELKELSAHKNPINLNYPLDRIVETAINRN
jgi:KDO2-lipid IV(A) lauroyltransferase